MIKLIKNKKIFLLFAIISVGILATLIYEKYQKPTKKKKIANFIWLDEPKDIANFQLTDHNNNKFTINNFSGRWSLIFFGYTYCPDICPTTMFDLRNFKQKLLDIDKKNIPQVIFVSVDPNRDKTKQIKKYVTHFDKSFIGLTGDVTNIDTLTKEIYGVYKVPENPKNDDYLVSHSGTIHLVNPDKKLAGIFTPPIKVENLTKDYIYITSYYK